MEWQLALTGVCVAVAVLYLGRRAWRTWRGVGRCGGCAAAPQQSDTAGVTFLPADRLQLRRPPTDRK